MDIDIYSLKEGDNALHFEEALEELGLPDHLAPQGTARLDGSLFKQADRLVLRATLSYELASECNRCLEPVQATMQAPVEACYVVSPTAPAGPSSPDEELKVISNTAEFIELAEPIREAILLASPLKSLCRPECRGLCPTCGQNLNMNSCTCTRSRSDPRWAPLQTLRR